MTAVTTPASTSTSVPTSTPATTLDIPERTTPRFGGLNLTLLRIEVVRTLRNTRTLIFTIGLPVAFFFIFGTNAEYADMRAGNGNVSAYIMIGMALYGALMATTGAGAAVSAERAQGWSRQLRLTPLNPLAYVLTKAASGMVLSLIAVSVVYLSGLFTKPDMPVSAWVVSFFAVWLGSVMFAAFGLFLGYLLPTENAMQVAGPLMAVLAMLGNVFIPLQPGTLMHDIARFNPMFGLHELAVLPLRSSDFDPWTVVNVVVWLAIFIGGSAWRMSRDTSRV